MLLKVFNGNLFCFLLKLMKAWARAWEQPLAENKKKDIYGYNQYII